MDDPEAMDSGAGRAAANLLAARGVTVLLAGKVGPKAATALKDAGIEVHEDLQGACQDVVARWLALGAGA
jgi:predicted Fe-Mo cluster-binding NifX family protein